MPPPGPARGLSRQIRRLHLTPRERDHLNLHQAGRLAQYRLARGLRLNLPEAKALIVSQMMEKIRDGDRSLSDLMGLGQTLLGRRQVMPGVSDLVADVQVEATFPDGTKLLTVHSPISSLDGDLDAALEGSFLPTPDLSLFGAESDDDEEATLTPGSTLPSSTAPPIIINEGRPTCEIPVTNTGDRPIQVGSHYPFLETNAALRFDRAASYGMRLNVPSGSSVRFEPGETKTVTLVEVAGNRIVRCGNGLTDGEVARGRLGEVMDRVEAGGFQNDDKNSAPVPSGAPFAVDRSAYCDAYGPTVGDRVMLGDTSLLIRVTEDRTVYGDECKFGGGKTLREGMGQATGVPSDRALDVVITNALIVDAVTGIIKADVGIKGGRIVGIGKVSLLRSLESCPPPAILSPAPFPSSLSSPIHCSERPETPTSWPESTTT